MALGDVSVDNLLNLLAGSNSKRMSTMYHNRGLEKANDDDFEGAIEDLQIALELEPTSDITKQMLFQCLMMRANELKAAGKPLEGMPYFMRARNL